MKLSDARKIAVKKHIRVRFRMANGMECILNEHGIAQVPDLKAVPDFNLEEEFARASEFVLEPVMAAEKQKTTRLEVLNREQLSALAGPAPAAEGGHDEHND